MSSSPGLADLYADSVFSAVSSALLWIASPKSCEDCNTGAALASAVQVVSVVTVYLGRFLGLVDGLADRVFGHSNLQIEALLVRNHDR